MFFPNTRILFMSQGEDEARTLIARCKYIYNHIDREKLMLPSIGCDNRDKIEFPVNFSIIEALPSTEKAGRSANATIVVRDEIEYHEYADVNYSSISPTIDRGGTLIEISTIHSYKIDTHFQTHYKETRAGERNAKAVFLSWRLRPLDPELGYTNHDEFKEKVLAKKYTPTQLRREYPETEIEAFSPVKTSAYFDVDAIEDMKLDVYRASIPHELESKYHGYVRIYKPPVPGRKYCCYCDPSDGKEDPHATVVIDWQTKEEVAVSMGFCPVEICAKIFDEFVRLYNNAFNSFGLTGFAGGAFSKCIEDLKTPNPFHQKDNRVGCWESSNIWKENILLLEQAIRNRQIRPHTLEALNQFSQFIQVEGHPPSIMDNKHDDFIAAWRGVLTVHRAMPAGTVRVSSFKYRDN